MRLKKSNKYVMISQGGAKMNYTDMLNKIIQRSGLKGVDIVKKCEEKGIKFTPNYLSVLRNTPGKIPSDEVSKAIAEACNEEYSDILIIQAYLDKAPDRILDFIQNIYDGSKQLTYDCIESQLKNVLTDEQYEAKKKEAQAAFNELTLAEFICGNMNSATNMQMQNFANEMTKLLTETEDEEMDGYIIVPMENAKFISQEQAKNLGLESE